MYLSIKITFIKSSIIQYYRLISIGIISVTFLLIWRLNGISFGLWKASKNVVASLGTQVSQLLTGPHNNYTTRRRDYLCRHSTLTSPEIARLYWSVKKIGAPTTLTFVARTPVSHIPKHSECSAVAEGCLRACSPAPPPLIQDGKCSIIIRNGDYHCASL